MAYVFITLTTALILNLTVLTLLKMGLRNAPASSEPAGSQPC